MLGVLVQPVGKQEFSPTGSPGYRSPRWRSAGRHVARHQFIGEVIGADRQHPRSGRSCGPRLLRAAHVAAAQGQDGDAAAVAQATIEAVDVRGLLAGPGRVRVSPAGARTRSHLVCIGRPASGGQAVER